MSYRLIVEINDPVQELVLKDNNINVLDREKDVIWDSVMTKDRLSNLVEVTLGYYCDEELFPYDIVPKAQLALNDNKLFDAFLDDVFEAYKSKYFDSLGMSYDESDSFIADHFVDYVKKHQKLFSQAEKKQEAPVR